MRRLRVLAAGGAVVLLALTAAPAPAAIGGAAPLEARIREAALDPGGETRVVVSVTGEAVDRMLVAADFTLTESGRSITLTDAKPLLAARSRPVAVVLAMDVSGSTAGRPLAHAKSAARSFLARLPAGVRVGVVAFGQRARVVAPLTTNRQTIASAIAGLKASGETALYDGVALAARTLGRVDGQRTIVLFSDGADTVSRASLRDAYGAAKTAKAPITSVGLVTRDFDGKALDSMATATGGRSLQVTQLELLSDAFSEVAKDITSQYVLTYTGAVSAPREIDLAVSVSVGDHRATDRIVVLNTRTERPGAGDSGFAQPPIPALAGSTGLYVGVGAAFVALLLFLGTVLPRGARGGPAARLLERGVRVYTVGAKRKARPADGTLLSQSPVARKAVELVDRLPWSQRVEEKLQLDLDRAAWPLRASELLLVQAAGALAGAIVGLGLFGSLPMTLLLFATGAAAPRILLRRRVSSRQSAFMNQLPDTLQLLAGSLQAGYGFMQAIDTLVREAPQPTSTEFQRVLAENRLGMPIEQALGTMADRVGSEDFRWVVMAIVIQRQVGGNLATLLTTVANTLRERERVRRQIKVLSAEGRMSAWVLTILPFAIAGYIAMVNPEFLRVLTGERIGQIMLGGALGLMGVGVAWMRKMIRIDV